jgi:tRNA uridine 5-carboxymethylaminomethyl modification enzyme
VQLEFLHSIPGLQQAEIMRPGYAVEYDFFPPTQLFPTLETRVINGLYFAGQVNGTSGYEEAAAQGLIAGTNAALKLQGRSPIVLDRSEAYIGVLIDDLVTRGAEEPYRMFTSRAEDRLLLRHDNADQRLTKRAFDAGLVPKERWAHFQQKLELLVYIRQLSIDTKLGGIPLCQLLKRPDFGIPNLPEEIRTLAPAEIWETIGTDVKYEGYLSRQAEQNRKVASRNLQPIPDGLDYGRVAGLRAESRQKLTAVRPVSLGQAARISGITHADITILSIWLTKNSLQCRQDATNIPISGNTNQKAVSSNA